MNLQYIRVSKNLTLRELSNLSGLSDGYISELETGKKVNPTFETLTKLSNALGVTIPELLVDKEEKVG